MIIPEVIVITGPTASGKSELGVRVAETIGGEVVSADSMQIYKYMDIGTAKPSINDMCGIPHHLIDFVPPFEDYSVARYVEDASKCIDEIISRKKIPVIVGGSGLYIDSLLKGRIFSARGNEKLRKELENEYADAGGEAMLKKLRTFDEISAAKLNANDKKRIVRAIEVYITTGKTISQHDIESKSQPQKYNAKIFALEFSDRSVLYERIDRRVNDMILKGLVKEVGSLLDMGVSRNCTSMQAIGYKEISAALAGETDFDFAIEKVKMESRRYAKRQLTWLRRVTGINRIVWMNRPDFKFAEKQFMELLHEEK